MTTINPTTRSTASAEGSSGFQISGNAAERYEQAVAVFMLTWSADLVGRAQLRSGDRVVDLACGTGFVARVAAERVGTRGEVVGIDINPAMAPHLPEAAIDSFQSTSVAALGGVDGFGELLRSAGLVVSVEEVERDIELPPMAEYYPILVSATPWSAAFEALTPRDKQTVITQLEDVAPASGHGCRVPMTVAVATASKPMTDG